jgi:hypothetical protein
MFLKIVFKIDLFVGICLSRWPVFTRRYRPKNVLIPEVVFAYSSVLKQLLAASRQLLANGFF